MCELERRSHIAISPHEGFADRACGSDGRLVPRTEPGALVLDPHLAGQQAVRFAAEAGSICVHGDTPGVVAVATQVRRALHDAGYRLAPFT